MALVTQLPDSYAAAQPQLNRFIQMSSALQQNVGGSPRQPDPPRSVVARPGTQTARVTWQAPANNKGIVGYRVFTPNENVPYQASRDPLSLFVDIPLAANGKQFVAIASYNAQGVESQKVPVVVTANSDQVVAHGSGINGTYPDAPPGWPY